MKVGTRNKSFIASLAVSTVCLSGFASGAHAAIYSESFESFADSTLAGQHDWEGGTWGGSGGVVIDQGTGADTTKVMSSGSATDARNSLSITGLQLTGDEKVTIQFDAATGTTGEAAQVGLGWEYGGNLGSPGPVVGFQGHFQVRERSFGDTTYARLATGGAFPIVSGNWYRIQAVWDLANGTTTMAVMDLSGNDPNIADDHLQTLYFNAAQTDDTASLGAINPTGWTHLLTRLQGDAATVSQMDNLSLTVPEPASLALCLGGLGLLTSRRRRNPESKS